MMLIFWEHRKKLKDLGQIFHRLRLIEVGLYIRSKKNWQLFTCFDYLPLSFDGVSKNWSDILILQIVFLKQVKLLLKKIRRIF